MSLNEKSPPREFSFHVVFTMAMFVVLFVDVCCRCWCWRGSMSVSVVVSVGRSVLLLSSFSYYLLAYLASSPCPFSSCYVFSSCFAFSLLYFLSLSFFPVSMSSCSVSLCVVRLKTRAACTQTRRLIDVVDMTRRYCIDDDDVQTTCNDHDVAVFSSLLCCSFSCCTFYLLYFIHMNLCSSFCSMRRTRK